jgi:mRNA-degrading endonuclease RelE of RelBE toxin-antitoxin system
LAYEIAIKDTADKVLEEFPAEDQTLIRDKISDLSTNPRPADHQAVPESTPGLFFVYADSYQITYRILDNEMHVEIVFIRDLG